MNKKVSVIMGVYNPEIDELIEAVDSIIKQTYVNWEFIICNDGSNSSIKSHLNRIEDLDDRIKIIHNDTNVGLHYALNTCLNSADGDYIIRQDADDISVPHRFETMVDYMNRNNDVHFASSAYSLFNETGEFKTIKLKHEPRRIEFIRGSVHAHATTIFRREAYDLVNGYRVSWETMRCEDYDLFMRMYANGLKGKNLEEVLYKVRMNESGISRRKYISRVKEFVVRLKGYKELKMPLWAYVFAIKPLVIGLIPFKLILKMKGAKC